MERYHALQGADAALVEILAVSYDSLTASQMAKCLNRLGKRNEKGRPFSTQDVDLLKEKPELAVLLKRMHRFLLSPEFLEPIAQHLVLEGNFERIASVVQSSVPARATNSTFAYFQFRCFEQAMRDYRVLLYTRRWDEAKQFLNACSKLPTRQQETRNVLEEFVFGLPDLDFFAKAPRQWLDEALSLRLYRALERLYLPEPWQKTVRVRLSQEEAPPDLRLAWATLLLWMGEMEEAVQEANRLCSDPQFVHQAANLRACAFLAMGKIEESLESFEETLALRTKATRKRKVFHEDAPGVFHLLTLLAQKGAAANKRIEALLPALSKLGGSDRGMLEEALDQYLDPNAFPPVDASVLRGRLLLDLGLSPEVVQQFQHRLDWPAPSGGSFPEDPFCLLSVVITRACSERSLGLFEIEYLTELYKDLKDSGMLWLAGEIEAALHLPQETSKKKKGNKEAPILAALNVPGIANLIGRPDQAERRLQLLELLFDKGSAPEKEKRLVWKLTRYGERHVEIQPKVQSPNKTGWTKGRPIALKRLYKGLSELDYLTEADRTVCAALREQVEGNGWGYHRSFVYSFALREALTALAGHPAVVNALGEPLHLEHSSPTLSIEEQKDGILLRIQPEPDEQEYCIEETTPHRWRVITFAPQQLEIARILGGGLLLPKHASDRLQRLTSRLGSCVSIQTDQVPAEGIGEERTVDPRPCVLLSRHGHGVDVQVVVRPLGSDGPSFAPGEGGELILAELDGVMVHAHRDRREERQRAMRVMNACPGSGASPQDKLWERLLPEVEETLVFLLTLQEMGEEVQIEWASGDPLTVSNPLEAGALSMRFKGRKDTQWFSPSGSLQIDADRVLELRELLDLLKHQPGRFIELSPGQFLTLTHGFRVQLDQLRGAVQGNKKQQRIHRLAALGLDTLLEGCGSLRSDRAWKSNWKLLHSKEQEAPPIPSTLSATLRPYQEDGVRWLLRLSRIGAGACLADDMGLGKTLQSLAVLAARGEEGPALVVAPTSVCGNWVQEIRRFAPSLRVHRLAATHRQEIVESLSSWDVLICSYGLLHQEQELLRSRAWSTLILDEAQAIKNPNTKRFKAAVSLNAGFRLACTGTPIENHLGELWSIFEFLNPDLLGSEGWFQENFQHPIEQQKDKTALAQLRNVVLPFVLRRTKAEVLDDLPSRTEVLVRVQLDEEEASFYEALRQNAVRELEQEDLDDPKNKIRILAQITRLRRACCNPVLIQPEGAPESGKLRYFLRMMGDFRENGHKVLVFSQFVGHLTLLRQALDSIEYSYQYLDGSTPPAKREQAVRDFQGGDGDAFLISLRAGGLGLNLTAADYVLHMDPWWNPAVEDQASDRAHRIGQTRPVTIYRLIAEGTIEERILALHKHKRSLADGLLEGTDMAGKLSTEELLNLIRSSPTP